MKLKEGGGSIAGTRRDFAWARPLGDAEQQADHQTAPQQPAELFGQFDRMAIDESGRLSLGHDLTQGDATRFAPYRVERSRDLRRADRIGNREPEDSYDCRLGYLADEPSPEGSEHPSECFAIVRHRQISR